MPEDTPSSSAAVTTGTAPAFQVRKGQILGQLGDNGAGKSTLVKTMSGVVTVSIS
jgi:ABC-type sugar transport system ATPase subunit